MKRRKTSKASVAQPTLPPRNPVAANPLLARSRAHGKTRKAMRRSEKVSVQKMSFERVPCLQATGSKDILTHLHFAA